MARMMRKGQSSAEYAVMVGLVVAAVVAMQLYARRGVQGKVKDVTDNFTKQGVGTTAQYEPYYATTNYTVAQSRASTDTTTKDGKIARTGINDTTSRTGSSTTGTDTAQDDAWK